MHIYPAALMEARRVTNVNVVMGVRLSQHISHLKVAWNPKFVLELSLNW